MERDTSRAKVGRSASEKAAAKEAESAFDRTKDIQPSLRSQFNLVMLWCASGFDICVLCIRADDGAVAKELAELRGLLKKQS